MCAIALAALAVGCGKKKDDAKKDEAAKPGDTTAAAGGGEAAKPAEAGGTEIPNIQGLVADVPPNVKPNGMGGAAGFHAEDDSFQLILNETSPEEAAKDIETMKTDSASVGGFKKWIKSEPTADGWVLVWEAGKFELAGEEMKEVGTMVSYQVRRKIGDKMYTCYGGVPTVEAAEVAIKACASVRPKS
ncbi:MAG TPA: hypothetical protein VMZ28_11530 [Kofleriaceae bacterium]|nr:hypothetical protein [Kofleriaceae bacterium]